MIYRSQVVVRYAETDQMGIAHHANYPIWYELARAEYIKACCMSYREMEQMGLLTPLLEVGCRYLFPARFEDLLTIETRATQITPSRIRFEYEIFLEGKKEPIHRGYTLHAFVNKELRPFNVRKTFPEIYQKIADALEPPVWQAAKQ